MKKIFSIIFLFLTLTGVALAHGDNLFQHFNSKLPSISERTKLYKGKDIYVGSALQNIALLRNLHSFKLGGLAPLPGSIVEGTSTAGWTDDGSIVRLNTNADNVGIGTNNPSVKLQVQGSAYVTGNLDMSGGTFNFSNGPATTTIVKASSGNVGFGTSTPSGPYSFSDGLFAPGTTTLGTLILASTTVQLRGVKYTLPASDGTTNQVLSTNGQGVLSFATSIVAPAIDTASSTSLVSNGAGSFIWSTGNWQLLKRIDTSAASSSIGLANLPPRNHLMIKLYVPAMASAERINLRFNADTTTNYGWFTSDRLYDTSNAIHTTDSNSAGATFINLSSTATTSAQYYTINILNLATQRKFVDFTGGISPLTLQPPQIIIGTGIWGNTSAQIHEITVNGASAVTLTSPVTFEVFGAD